MLSKNRSSVDMAMNIDYVGGASFFITGQAGMGLGKIATKFRLNRYQGVLLLRFTLDPSPRLQVMLSEMPSFALSLGYGNQSLGRISRVLILVVKSLLYNHAVFPNYQSLVIRQHAESLRDLFFAPMWRSTRSFIRCHFDSMLLSDDILQIMQGGSELSCAFILGPNRYRTEELLPQKHIPLHFRFQASLPLDSGIDSLQIVVLERRKKAAKRTALLTLNVPFTSFKSNMLSNVKISDAEKAAFTFRGEVYLSQETFTMDLNNPWQSTVGLDLHAVADQTERYFDGINWGNLKLAWSKFRAAPEDNLDQSDQLKELLNTLEEPELENNVPLSPLVDSTIAPIAASSPVSSAGSAAASSDSLANPELTDIDISLDGFQFMTSKPTKEYHYQGFGWVLSALADELLVRQEYQSSLEPLFETEGWTSRGSICSLSISNDLIIFQKTAGFRVFDYIQRSVGTKVRFLNSPRDAERQRVSFSKGNGEELGLQMKAEDASKLLLWLCGQQKMEQTSIKYRDSRDASLLRTPNMVFLVIKYQPEGDDAMSQLVIPFAKADERAAEVIVHRICKRAKKLIASGPDLMLMIPRVDVEEDQLEGREINGFQVKSLPAPVRIFLHHGWIFVRSKIYGSNMIIPRGDITEIIAAGGNRRRSLGFSILSSKHPPVEFYKISAEDMAVLESWCTTLAVKYDK